jgi:hypothetical protein
MKARTVRWLLRNEPAITAAVVILLALFVSGAADPVL